MFIYNVTTKVSWSVHNTWLQYIRTEFMPAMIDTKCFVRFQLLKLHEQDDAEGPTYIAQYFAESKALYNRYIELYADDFRKEYNEKWGNNIIDFSTLLEVLNNAE